MIIYYEYFIITRGFHEHYNTPNYPWWSPLRMLYILFTQRNKCLYSFLNYMYYIICTFVLTYKLPSPTGFLPFYFFFCISWLNLKKFFLRKSVNIVCMWFAISIPFFAIRYKRHVNIMTFDLHWSFANEDFTELSFNPQLYKNRFIVNIKTLLTLTVGQLEIFRKTCVFSLV